MGTIKRSYLFFVAFVMSMFAFVAPANATVDVSDAAASLSGLTAPIAVLGGVILTILVAIKAWKMIRRAM